MMENNTVRVQVSSDADYERLIAEVYYNDSLVALVNQEGGPGVFGVEFPAAYVEKIPLDVLIKGLEMAKAELTPKEPFETL